MAKASPNPTREDLGAKLDLVARLLAYLVAAQHDNLEGRAVTLKSMGLSPAEIARVCNSTPNTISVRLTEAKRKSTRKGSKRSRKTGRKR